MEQESKPTKQARVSPISGVAPPVDKQFGKPNGNPRHNGAWKKEDTARYKLEQMLKLSEAELLDILNDKEAPLFERRLARSLLNENEFRTSEAMINQVYGTPKQQQEVSLAGDTIEGIKIAFADRSKDGNA